MRSFRFRLPPSGRALADEDRARPGMNIDNTSWSGQLVCPEDRSILVETQDNRALSCSTCGRTYPREGNVVRLCENDPFYEGAYQSQVRYLPRGESIWKAWPLWLLNSGYVWAVRRHVAPGSLVIELGSGGGIAYFGSRYRMIGCDLSGSSLVKTAQIYSTCIQTDVTTCIPVPAHCADAVISSCFWEHLSPGKKDDALDEIQRVLKPGGKIVFLYDVETRNPLIERMRRLSPDTYRERFLDNDGHVGYESWDANITRFVRHGFEVLASDGLEMTPVLSPSVFEKFSDWGARTDRLFDLLAKLGSYPWLYPYTALQRAMDSMLRAFLPDSWARMTIVVCRKPGA